MDDGFFTTVLSPAARVAAGFTGDAPCAGGALCATGTAFTETFTEGAGVVSVFTETTFFLTTTTFFFSGETLSAATAFSLRCLFTRNLGFFSNSSAM